MLQGLKIILDIQELDIKMIRLMRLKKERQGELRKIEDLKTDLQNQISLKQTTIETLRQENQTNEEKIAENKTKISRFESQQDLVKKIEEFNALTQEISHADRERVNLEQQLNDIAEQLMTEEDVLSNLQETFHATVENSKALEKEIHTSIEHINEEGVKLKSSRDALTPESEVDSLKIYERLLNNKKDRVIVPITNRCCSGCNIVLTAQQENMVRKAERLVFCEHCSRILYWLESMEAETTAPTKRRRRKAVIS